MAAIKMVVEITSKQSGLPTYSMGTLGTGHNPIYIYLMTRSYIPY